VPEAVFIILAGAHFAIWEVQSRGMSGTPADKPCTCFEHLCRGHRVSCDNRAGPGFGL